MKNLKKIVALVVAIAMISTLLVPAFANTFTYSDEARIMYDLGLFMGEDPTDYVPNLEAMLNRETGVTMLLRLFGEEEAALALSDEEAASKLAKFTDASDVAGWAKKQVAYATDKGYVRGFPNGTFGPKQALNGKAYCSLILQMLGYDGDFDYHTAATSLSQVDGLSSAEANKFNSDAGINRDSLVGISFGTLQAKYKGSEVTVIEKLIELGKVDEQLAKDKGVLKARIVEVGELEDVTVKIGAIPAMPATVEVTYDDETTGEVAVTWPSVNTTEAGEQEIEGTIAGTTLKATVKVIVQPDELLVTKVSATNLKEVVVEFNAELDADTVNNDNIKIKDTAGSAELQEDKRTVIVTITGQLTNQGDYTLIVENVKDTTGVQIEKVEKDFSPFDGTIPEALEIKVTGPTNLEIVFSEPIKEDGEVEIKDGSTTIGSGSFSGYGTSTISIVVWDEMKDGTTYEVTVKGFKDYANFANISKTFEVEYVKDATPPVATITKVDQMHVRVEFNKPVKGLQPGNFYHTFSSWEALGIYRDEAMTDEIEKEDSVSTVWVKFANDADDKPLAEGRQRVGIRARYDDVDVVDNWGNKFEAVEIEVTVTADRDLPKVTSIEVEDESTLKVTFDKVVFFNEDNIEVLDTDGKEIDGVSINVITASPEKEFIVELGEDLSGKKIVVKIKNVEDNALQPNKMAEYTQTIEITDKTAPTVDKVSYKSGNPAYLYFFFNEDVNNTAVEKSNYSIMRANGSLKNLEKNPSFFDGNRVVRIELTEEEENLIFVDNLNLFVQRIQDRAENAMAGMIIPNGELVSVAADYPEVDEIKATAKDRLVITFDQRLIDASINRDQFVVNVDSAPVTIKTLTAARNSDGNTVVTITVDAEFAADVSDDIEVVIQAQENRLRNIFGVEAYNRVVTTIDTIVDGIAPNYTKDDITVSGSTVTIEFNEDINPASVSIYTFEVRNNNVTAVAVVDNEVRLTVRDSYASEASVRVSQRLDVEDSAGNKYRNTDTIQVTAQ
ncbi:UNVERIFIED_CONTAM: S-layer family protein [Acetivibrio alkalicellulosi]